MRVAERMQLLENIGTELQKRYVWEEVTAFVSQCGIDTPDPGNYEGPNSKRYFAKYLLGQATNEQIERVAKELDLDTDSIVSEPPQNWKASSSIKAFISHVSG